MISEDEVQFLSSALSQIPSAESMEDIEFTDEDLDDFRNRFDSGSSLSVERFFVDTGHQICTTCGNGIPTCTCASPTNGHVHHLDAGYIVEEWCNQVGALDHYQSLIVEEEGPPIWEANAFSREFGDITFLIVSRTDRLKNVEPDLFEREITVSLVEADEVANRAHIYMWYQLLTEDHHDELHSLIRDAVTPLSEGICDLNSGVASENSNTILNNLRKFFIARGFQRIDAQHEAGHVGRTIDFSDIEFASQNSDDEIILVCGCEQSASDIHLHYVTSGEIQPVAGCETAELAAQRMRDKIDRLETLHQNAHNLSGRTRALALAATTVSIGPVVAAATGFFDLGGFSFDGYPYVPELFVSVLLILLFTALIYPSLKLSLFSWDIRSYQIRLREKLP